jgi:hypothetical protein
VVGANEVDRIAATELLCHIADGNDLSGLYAARNHYFVTQRLEVREDYADRRSRRHLSRNPLAQQY